MKHLPAILLVLMTGMSLEAAAGTVEDNFREGVRLYGEAASPEEFALAAEAFRNLNETYRIKAPEVLLNLGAAEFLSSGAPGRGDRTGEAMLSLHKTIVTAPESLAAGLADKNLDIIRQRLNEQRTGSGDAGYVFAPYNDGWTAMFSWLSPGLAGAIFLSIWAALFIVLAIRRLLNRKLSVILGAVLAVSAAITGVGAFGASRVDGYTTGVVLEDAPLYDEFLSLQSEDNLPEGLEFRLMERKDQRLRIRLSSGKTGWVPEDRVGIP